MLGSLRKNYPVTVIGGGFAGLSLSYRLKQLGIPFTLYEKERVGGKIKSETTSWGPVESAANTLYMNKEAASFIRELNLPYIEANTNLKRWIWSPKELVSPLSPAVLLKVILNVHKKFPANFLETNVEEIFKPLIGQKLIDELLSPALQGIYSAQASELHFLSLFPFSNEKKYSNYLAFLKDLKKEIKNSKDEVIRGSVTFPGGMQYLIDSLKEQVKDHIVFDQIAPWSPNMVICTNALEAAEILNSYHPQISEQLKKIEYLPLTSFTFFTSKPLPELKKSFGILFPQKYKSFILGIIQPSEIFPENYKTSCYTVICKGNPSRSEIISEVESRIKGLRQNDIIESYISSWERALPVYNNNRYQSVNKIKQLIQEPGLILFGNYTNGISLRSMIEETRKLN